MILPRTRDLMWSSPYRSAGDVKPLIGDRMHTGTLQQALEGALTTPTLIHLTPKPHGIGVQSGPCLSLCTTLQQTAIPWQCVQLASSLHM